MEPFKHTITVNNKRYEYSIEPIDKKMAHVTCPGARLNQDFLVEDIPALLQDLPEIIIGVQDFLKKQDEVIRFRVSSEEKNAIQKKAAKAGYPTISAFMRAIALG